MRKLLIVYIIFVTSLVAGNKSRMFVGIEGHGSIFSSDPNRPLLADSVGFGMNVGYYFSETWTILFRLENNRWFTSEFDRSLQKGAINTALGVGHYFFEGRLRSSVMVGTSTLQFNTIFNQEGSTGIYFEARPIGFRFQLTDELWFYHDPWILSVVAPVVFRSPSLVFRQFRTTIGFQYVFN